MMEERSKAIDEISIAKLLIIFVLKLESITSMTNHSCYTCVEPLMGYTDYTDSCRFFNPTSSMALSYIKDCSANSTGEYECRKLVISYRSVDTYLRRDCVPKGLCSWKDKSQAMMNTPVSNCVYTNDIEQKLECIYCCNTPLCNRTTSYYTRNQLVGWLLLLYWWRKLLEVEY